MAKRSAAMRVRNTCRCPMKLGLGMALQKKGRPPFGPPERSTKGGEPIPSVTAYDRSR